MNEQTRQAVLKLIAEAKPASLLSIGPQKRAFYAPYLAAHPDCRLTRLAADQARARLPRLGRFDFAFVADTLERLAKADAAALIARLRDLHAPRFALVLALGAPAGGANPWSHEELIAYGLARLDREASAHGGCALYGYDIARYKHTPDWLNSEDWAHPERFDRYRW